MRLITSVKKVAIVDYGLGNRQSIAEAIRKVGHEPVITRRFDELISADRIILPGVGAFGMGIDKLRSFGLIPVLEKLVMREGKPLLGICLGFQLLANKSEEFGVHAGLGWIDATVRRIQLGHPKLKVPHVGWSETKICGKSKILAGIPDNSQFYYVHSYHVNCRDESSVVATVNYGYSFAAALENGNITATQFHPEKSQRYGLSLIKNFIENSEWSQQG